MSYFESFIREQAKISPLLYIDEAVALFDKQEVTYADDPVLFASHQLLVTEALRDGRLIQAVIMLRNVVPGLSIREAKETVEALKKTL